MRVMAKNMTGIQPIFGETCKESFRNSSVAVKWLVIALYLAETLTVAVMLLAYRFEGKEGFGDFFSSRPGLLCIGAGFALVLTMSFIVQQCRQGIKSESRKWFFGVVMNLVTVVGLLVFGELGLRIVTVESNTQSTIFGKRLYPRQWEVLAENFKAILRKAEGQPTFWVEDKDLGWTVGPGRKSSDGLYFSSAEGLRSTEVGRSYRQESKSCRIALVGDSYTFGEEVVYEDAWAYLLSQEFGSQCQILNFGVGGYGVDQMYLRYMRDVRPWNPDVVVLAFVNHDVVRTFSVYSFLLFADGETPFAKPRFVLQEKSLSQINLPLIAPNEIFSKASIKDLPFIEYDANYKDTEWDRSEWRPFYSSYIFRLLTSVYPLHERERSEISDVALQEVNRELFKAFETAVRASGAKPLIVYLPSVEEVPQKTPWEPIGLKILREGKIPHIDLRDCMAAGYTLSMFMPAGRGQHYSPQGNREAARCLRAPIQFLIPRKASLQE